MQEVTYDLHSVVIHDGSAQQGHFYSYIYDFNQNVWRKYNDIHVKTVSEEEVLKDT